MTPQETFVTRLRRHRQRNRVSLEEIAAEMRVKGELIEALENNDLSEWPRGLYARALIRTYATVVGLDPGDTVDDVCRLFPQGDRRASGTSRNIASIVASESEYRDEFPHGQDRRGAADQPPPAPPVSWQMPVTQAARAAWAKLASAAGPYLRARRAPRTTM